MTYAHASQGRSLASLEAGAGEWLHRATSAWTKHRDYRRTLAELRALPLDGLLDLEMYRGDLKAIAHHEVYGH